MSAYVHVRLVVYIHAAEIFTSADVRTRKLFFKKSQRVLTGMTGIDEELALLKKVRADLSVKQEKSTANEELEAAQAFYARQAFQYAYTA